AAHWWHEDARMTLGVLRVAAGDIEGGIEAMRHAGRLDIYDPKPFANIARIESMRNRPEAACEAQKIAVARDPDQPSRYLILAELLEQLGHKEAAAAALRRAD